jgi:hypothetical protein
METDSGWLTKNLLSRAPHSEIALGPRGGLCPFSFCVILDVTQAADRKKYLPNVYHNMMKNMLY